MPFDYDLLVIGAGSGGLAAAERAAPYGAKVAIVEQANTGGACVNYGCIPEKLLDYAAGFVRFNRMATDYGWNACDRHFNWSTFIQAKDHYIAHLNQLHFDHLRDAGVQFIQGQASFVKDNTVVVNDCPLTAAKILIAVGAVPEKPNIPGIEQTITWRELYHLKELPKHIAIVGNDPIGVKIAGSLNALGTDVTQITATATILPELDSEIAMVIQSQMHKQGVQFIHQQEVKQITSANEHLCLQFTDFATPCNVDTVVMDVPRRPNLAPLNLPAVGIQLTESGAIRVDAYSRTTHASIFAVGDCTDRMPLTPSAISQARAFADTEFGNQPRLASLDCVPMLISSHPEAASIGLSEAQARQQFQAAVRCYYTQFKPLFYGLSPVKETSFVKVIVNQQDSERLLGIHMVGNGAGEIIQSLGVSLKLGATKHNLDRAIGIHPSSGEELFSL